MFNESFIKIATSLTEGSIYSYLIDKVTFILMAVFVLAFIILVHELGHFLTALSLNLKVEKFSIGFGRPIFSFKRKGIEYILAYIPLGGYVKFYGEEIEEGVEPDPDHFNLQPVWKRFLTTLAGPVANLLLAVVLLASISMSGIYEDTLKIEKPIEGSSLYKNGLKGEDLIKALDGKTVNSFKELSDIFATLSDKKEATLTVKRDSEEIKISFIPDKIGFIAVLLKQNEKSNQILIDTVLPGPALKAGLEANDKIVAIDDLPINTTEDLQNIVKPNYGKNLVFKIKRGSKLIDINVTPDSRIDPGFITERVKVESSLLDSIAFGFTKTFSTIILMGDILLKLITGEIPTNQIAGPIGILEFAGKAAKDGLVQLLGFIALISINLGVLNLLPIPVLDGGHLLFFTIESIIRKPLSIRVQDIAQKVGIGLLFLLMGLAFYNDLSRLMGRLIS